MSTVTTTKEELAYEGLQRIYQGFTGSRFEGSVEDLVEFIEGEIEDLKVFLGKSLSAQGY